MTAARKVRRDHPPMLIDYQSTSTKRIVRTVCECCGVDVAVGRQATREEQDAHAIACSGPCTSRHLSFEPRAASKAGAK